MRKLTLVLVLLLAASCTTPEQERRERILEFVAERRGIPFDPPSNFERTLRRFNINPGVYITFTF